MEIESRTGLGVRFNNMKTNRRSQLHKADKFRERALSQLTNYTWETEERIFLEIMALGKITISDLREAAWTDVKRGFNSILIKGKELPLPEESISDFDVALKELKDFSGEPIDPRDTLHKV